MTVVPGPSLESTSYSRREIESHAARGSSLWGDLQEDVGPFVNTSRFSMMTMKKCLASAHAFNSWVVTVFVYFIPLLGCLYDPCSDIGSSFIPGMTANQLRGPTG